MLVLHAVASSLIAAAVAWVAYLLLGRRHIYAQRPNKRQSKNNKHALSLSYPPMIPAGIIETAVAMSGDDLPWFFLRMAKALKTHVYRLPVPILGGAAPMVAAVGDPTTAIDILSDPRTTKPLAIYGIFDACYNGQASIFTSNGDFWHKRRKGVAPAFSSKHVKRMNAVALEQVDKWIRTRLIPAAERDEAFDVGEELIHVTLSSISKTAFEYDMSEEERTLFLGEYDRVAKEFMQKSLTNPLRRVFGLFLAERRRAHLGARRLQELCLRIIDAHRNAPNPIEGTVIERIVHNDAYEHDSQRAADVLTFLVAGHDTTAYTVAWVLKELARHPDEQRKLRHQLRSLAPEEWNKSEALRIVVKEGMRLHPVAAAISVRTTGRDFETKSGMLLPKGSIVFIPPIMAHRNFDIFDEPDSFLPSRWENPTKSMNEAFIPFYVGKQNCVGQSLANAQLLSIVPKICMGFDLRIEEEGRTEFFLTLKPVGTKLRARKLL